ncbi:MAG: hypothetical protein KDJ88_07865 [Bauldia sp.]|nr:hypothetical protein [Bauldia sp.]
MTRGVATIGRETGEAPALGAAYLLAGGIAVMAMFLSFHPPAHGVVPFRACVPAASANSCGADGVFDPFPARA